MALDKLVDSAKLDSDLSSVADAIRSKGGTSAQLAFPEGFASAVQAIPTGITTETDPTVPAWAKQPTKPTYTAAEVGAVAANQGSANAGKVMSVGSDGTVAPQEAAAKAASIPMGQLDSTSTATVMTAQVDGITSLHDGVCVWLKNGVVTSASGVTLNINGLGAKPLYSSLAAASRSTTIFNVNYTLLLVYNSTRVEGGCWDVVYGIDSNTTYSPVSLGFGYGVCSTAAATAAKVVSISSYQLTTGGIVTVKFDADVPASATLNVSSKGAKAIYYRGAPITSGVIKAYDVVTMIYSTVYHVISIARPISYHFVYLNESEIVGTEIHLTSNTFRASSGGIVAVKFLHDVPANATLLTNSDGAMPIRYKGSSIADGVIKSGSVVTMMCVGSSFEIINIEEDVTGMEVDVAVEAAWPGYSITYYESYVDRGQLLGIGVGAAPETGAFAAKAEAGDTVYIKTTGHWAPQVTGASSGTAISCSNLGNNLFSLTMPEETINVDLFFDD